MQDDEEHKSIDFFNMIMLWVLMMKVCVSMKT